MTSVDSAIIAAPTESVPATMIGLSVFGRMWPINRLDWAPRQRAGLDVFALALNNKPGSDQAGGWHPVEQPDDPDSQREYADPDRRS